MADEGNASRADDRVLLTLPALRVEVERLRDELTSMRTALREEGKRLRTAVEEERSATQKATHERDLERERRERLEKDLAALRAEIERLRGDHDGRLRAEERVAAIDEAAKMIERNLEAILDRRERAISEKDRVIASLARALGSAERERDILVEGPASGPATLLRRLLGGRKILVPAPRPSTAAKAPPPAPPPGEPAPAPNGSPSTEPAATPAPGAAPSP